MTKLNQPHQIVKRINLSGEVAPIEFNFYCGQYLVKNYSSADIYVSFEENVDESTSIKIASGFAQRCIINERGGVAGQDKAKFIYIKGNGEVEVQQLWY